MNTSCMAVHEYNDNLCNKQYNLFFNHPQIVTIDALLETISEWKLVNPFSAMCFRKIYFVSTSYSYHLLSRRTDYLY